MGREGPRGKDMQGEAGPVFDLERLEEWAALAREDPEAFERRRREVIEAYIESVPEAHRRRLRGLQWQIDTVRRRAGSSLGACVAISHMMWASVERFGRLEDSLGPRPAARVLPLRPRRGARAGPGS